MYITDKQYNLFITKDMEQWKITTKIFELREVSNKKKRSKLPNYKPRNAIIFRTSI